MTETQFITTVPVATPFLNSYWVVPGRFLAGEYPGSPLIREAVEKISSLLQSGIDTFIDLTLNDPLNPYEPILKIEANKIQKSYSYLKSGFRDFSVPNKREMKKILDSLDGALQARHNVYLHCWGGIGRTGTVVGCYLVRHGLSGQAALNEITRLRLAVPGSRTSPETDEQRKMVLNWRTNE